MPDDTTGIEPTTEAEADATARAEEEVKPDADSEESASDEKETQSESSTDEKPADEAEGEEAPDESSEQNSKEEQGVKPEPALGDTVSKEPKPVVGETLRERALRKEVERLRDSRRAERAKELMGDTPRTAAPKATAQKSSRIAELEKKFSGEELKNFREALEVMAEDMGFARKEDLEIKSKEERAQDYLADFVAKHPEYEKDEELWTAFKNEFQQFYKIPADPRHLPETFERIHKSLGGSQPEDERAKLAAKTEKVKAASHSATKVASRQEEGLHQSEGKLDPSLKSYLKGDFSDLDL